jgi:hypothetical protein
MSNYLGRYQELVRAFILISPNWELEFHVHIDVFQLVVVAMFTHNPISKID